MRRILLSLLCLVTTFLSYAQSEGDSLDNRSMHIPDSINDPWSIGKYLTLGLESDEDKVRAIFIWITHNISYDVNELKNPTMYHSLDKRKESVLLDRKGICADYSSLFLDLCRAVDIEAHYIAGYTQHNGKVSSNSHAWNAVLIDNQYYLLDATWAAGYVSNNTFTRKFNERYYLTDPKDFIKQHIPFDPIWQLLDNPIRHRQFMHHDFSGLTRSGDFPYSTYIHDYYQTDKLTRLESSYHRISNDAPNYFVLKNYLNHLEQEIFVEQYNNAIQLFELYRIHRFNKFKRPKLSDSSIRAQFISAEEALYDVELKSKIIPRSESRSLNEVVSRCKQGLLQAKVDMNEERKFLDKYLNTAKPMRKFLSWSVD